MRPFTYSRPKDIAEALNQVAAPEAKFLGGGTNLVDLMKTGTERPAHLVDITRLPLTKVEAHADGLRIGALVRNSELAEHPAILKDYPLVSQAILAGASPQLRNMATTGGNLLQRTRCPYFYDPTYAECNKRKPGSGCAAIAGYNRIHAILGTSEQCIATYPGDMAVALLALDARVLIRGPHGDRSVGIDDFYKVPGTTPQIETDLHPNEIITGVELPAASAGARSHYVKVRDRNSYAFALASAAAAIETASDGTISRARIALGGVGTKPWINSAANESLRGKALSEDAFRAAAEIALQGAKPQRYNAFKVELAKRAAVRALMAAGGMA